MSDDIKIIDLKQRHVEEFHKLSPLPKDAQEMHPTVYAGACVRAACLAGWFDSPVFCVEDVDNMSPGRVRDLFSAAMKAYSAAMDVPPS
jgi:hypothetical protein